MRRIVAVAAFALVVVGCAKQESATADSPAAAQPAAPAPLSAAAIAGSWEAVGMPMDKDTVVVRFTMNNDSTGQKSETVFASGDKITASSTTFDGDSAVSVAGPFKSQVRKGVSVTTRVVWRMQDGKLVGTSQSKYSNGDSATFRLTATKKP